MYDRDVQSIRLVGTLCVWLGLVLFLITFLASLLALFSGISPDPARFTRGILAAILALLASIALISCGSELQRLRMVGRTNLENLRLVWAALVVMMTLTLICAAFLLPPLVGFSALVLLAAFAIRPAIIRLTR